METPRALAIWKLTNNALSQRTTVVKAGVSLTRNFDRSHDHPVVHQSDFTIC